MSRLVMLILRSDSHLFVVRIAREIPVWIADTPENALLKAKIVDDAIPVTWFPVKADESLEIAAARIAASLDDHYNEYSQDPAYDTLVVHGVDLKAMSREALREIGFVKFEESPFGLVAVKEI